MRRRSQYVSGVEEIGLDVEVVVVEEEEKAERKRESR